MEYRNRTALAFIAVAMMVVVAFVGFVVINDSGSDADGATDLSFEGSVSVNGTTYSDFNAAIEAAKKLTTEKKEIKFESDSKFKKSTTTENWNSYDVSGLTINLNKKTITVQNKLALVLIGPTGDFTVCDGTIETDTSISYSLFIGGGDKKVASIQQTKNVYLKDLTFDGGINIRNAGTVTFDDVNVTAHKYYAVWNDHKASVVIKSGTYSTVDYGTYVLGGQDDDFSTSKDTSIQVDGGTFLSSGKYGLVLSDKDYRTKPTINGGSFNALAEAVEYAAPEATITLAGNVTLDADKAVGERAINVTKDMTINLGGYTLTVNSESSKAYYYGAINVNGASLELKNGSIKVPYVSGDAHSVIKVQGSSVNQKAKLTVQGVKITSGEGKNDEFSGYGIFAAAYSEVTIEGDTTITADYAAISGNGSVSGATDGRNTSITINGGTFESRKAACVYFPNVDKLTVTGGTFTGATGFEIRAGEVSITHATVSVKQGGSLGVADSGQSPLGVAFAVICTSAYASTSEMSVTIGNNTLNLADGCYAFYIGAPLSDVKYITANDVQDATAIGKEKATVSYGGMTLSATGSASKMASMLINGDGNIIKVGGEIKGVSGILSFDEKPDVTISNATGVVEIKGLIGNLTLKDGNFSEIDIQTTSVEDLKISNIANLDILGTVTCEGDIELSKVSNIYILDKLIIKSGSTLTIDGSKIIDFTSGQMSITTNLKGGFDAVLDGKADLLVSFTLGVNDKLTITDTGELSIDKDKTLKLNEGAVISGRIVGQGPNAIVVDGLKAGSDGVTFTSGSLRINGIIVKDGETAGVTVKIVSGTEVYISGQLEKGATMEVEAGTTVTIENGATFTSNGTITNNGAIVNSGTITNAGTLKVTDQATVTGNSIVNSGIIADKRTSGTAVPIDTSSDGVVVVTEHNASAYEGSSTKVVVETDKITSGTVTSDTNEYVFVDEVTTTGDLNVIMNDGYNQYTITIPTGTTIVAGTIISVEYLEESSTPDTIKYKIETNGITEFSVKVPVPTGYKSAKVLCDGREQGISNVKYNSSQGYVTFDAGHNSTFTIVLSSATPSSGTSSSSDSADVNAAFIGAIVALVMSIIVLAVVIKRR